MGRLLIAFGSVSVLAVTVFVLVEGLGVDAGLDAVTPTEEPTSRRAHDFLYRWTLLSGSLALVLGLVLGGRFALAFIRPARVLEASASELAAGNRDARCRVDSGVRELDDLARSFNRMADVLQAHEASRSRLLSDIAHELRSPLTVVTGQLEEMRDGLVPADREALAAVHAECQRLAAAAQDLARLAAEEPMAASISTSAFDLGEVASQAVAVRERAFGGAGIRLLGPVEAVVVCSDEQRIRQILGNLLDNCFRYCGEGDLVRVSTSKQDLAWLVVDDSGPGMAVSELQLATGHGYRGDNSAGTAGTGAGLALTQRWAEALGGHVELCQSPLGGLRVAIGLPGGGCRDRNRGSVDMRSPATRKPTAMSRVSADR
jgi:two-component system sensor histidine kinase BaeS